MLCGTGVLVLVLLVGFVFRVFLICWFTVLILLPVFSALRLGVFWRFSLWIWVLVI